MSKKETIEDRVKSLQEREQKIKLELDNDSDEMKSKVMRVGKIALITGVVAILGYWIFNTIFQDEDEEKPKKKKKRNKESKGFTQRVTALAMPYLNRVLDGILNEEEDEEKTKTDSKEKTTDED